MVCNFNLSHVLYWYASSQKGYNLPYFPYAVILDTPLDYSLDDCIEYIQEDELVEVTPASIRMCKNPKITNKKR